MLSLICFLNRRHFFIFSKIKPGKTKATYTPLGKDADDPPEIPTLVTTCIGSTSTCYKLRHVRQTIVHNSIPHTYFDESS